MEGRAWRFTGLTTGHHLSSTLQRQQGLQGVRPLLSFAVFVCTSLFLVVSALSLVFLSISHPLLCFLFPSSSFFFFFSCSFCLPAPPPSSLPLTGLKAHRQQGLLKPFWTEASLCICQCCLFLFGENLRRHYC